MIKRFSCHNFRNIKVSNLEFEKINILIGPNNSGKSNFIKALTFFPEMLKNYNDGNLKSSFLNAVSRNGWNHMMYSHAAEAEVIDFDWELDLNNMPIHYKFAFGVGNTVEQCNITLEELNSSLLSDRHEKEFNYFRCHDKKIGQGAFSSALKKGQKNKRLFFDVDSKESLMMQFKDILLKDQTLYGDELIRVEIAQLLYDIQDYFNGFSVYASSQFDTNKIREPVNIKNLDEVLSRSALNFVNIFNRYKSQDIFWKSLFEERMRELIPDIKVADTVNFYDKLIFKLAYNDEQYDLSDVSEGTIKGLILNMLINMKMDKECTLLAIDEPETNLHPAWQKVVGNWIQTTNTFRQCFISTHSPDFLDVFTEEFKHGKVAVFVFDNGLRENVKKIRYENIANELGDWELGDLYRTNDPALGGWPW